MSLKFGFGLYDEDPAARQLWERKFQALSDADKAFFHEKLPAILIITDIGFVSEETVPHIVNRLEVVRPDWVEKRMEEYLKRFIGYLANVRTLSKRSFIRKITERAEYDIDALGDEEIKDLCRSTEDLVLDEATIEELPLFINRHWTTKKAEEHYKELMAKGESGCRSSKEADSMPLPSNETVNSR